MEANTQKNHTDAKVEEILAHVQQEFPTFRIFSDFRLGANLRNHFAALSDDDRKALNAYVMDNADAKEFGQVVRWLRIVNGKTAPELAEKVLQKGKDHAAQISNVEAGDRTYTPEQFVRLRDGDLFPLSPEHKKQLTALWRASQHKNMPACDSVDAVCAEAKKQLDEYHAGTRLPANVMSANEVLRSIFEMRQCEAVYGERREFQSMIDFSHAIFPDQYKRYFNGILFGNNPLENPEPLEKIAQALDVNDKLSLLSVLPYLTKHGKKIFREEVRTTAQILAEPELHESLGAWLLALREASQQTQKQVRDRIGMNNTAVGHWEQNICTPRGQLDQILGEKNPYGLPTDAQGKVLPEIATKFRYLVTGIPPKAPQQAHKDAWHERVKKVRTLIPVYARTIAQKRKSFTDKKGWHFVPLEEALDEIATRLKKSESWKEETLNDMRQELATISRETGRELVPLCGVMVRLSAYKDGTLGVYAPDIDKIINPNAKAPKR